MTEYQPGVCNIGRDERRKRRRLGVLTLLAAGGYVLAILVTNRPATLLLGAFPLLFGGVLGLLQDRLGFCAGFAALARYDLSGSGGSAGKATDREALRTDRLRAVQIAAGAAAIAAIATGLLYAAGTAL